MPLADAAIASWADFEAAGEQTRELLRELAADPAALVELLDAAAADPGLRAASSAGAASLSVVLAQGGEGPRLRIVWFREDAGGPPARGDRPRSVLVLAGEGLLTWYDERDGRPRPLLTRVEGAGSSFTLHPRALHAFAAAAGCVLLVAEQAGGPAADGPPPGHGPIAPEDVALLRAELARRTLI